MKFRKKPVVIDAHQFNGHAADEHLPLWYAEAIHAGKIQRGRTEKIDNSDFLSIGTLEGTMLAYPGDWIIMGIKGEFYPCKTDIFEASYEAVP